MRYLIGQFHSLHYYTRVSIDSKCPYHALRYLSTLTLPTIKYSNPYLNLVQQ